MRCPNCGATNTASDDFCDRCGASLPVGVGAVRRQPPRGATNNRPAKKPPVEKRSGTLGDLFKTGSPFTGPQQAQKSTRSRGQTFLAWRESRRNADANANTPPAAPAPPPNPRARGRIDAAPPPSVPRRDQPPDWSPFPEYAPGGQTPLVPDDPWHGAYGPPPAASSDAPFVEAPPAVPVVPAVPGQANPWDSDRAWNVLPQSGPPSGPISGSSSGWRNRLPMMELDEEAEPAWAALPHYGQDGRPTRRATPARLAAAHVSRAVMNVLLIGLILLILAVPISIGLNHLASLQPKAPSTPQVVGTAVPTAPVAQHFTGYAVALYSLSYPSAWKLTAATPQLPDGTAANVESFSDGHGTTASLYTTLGTADLLRTYVDELATYTAVNAALQPSVLGGTRTYDGVKWLESDYTYSGIVDGKAATVQMRVLAAISGATAYIFVLTAPRTSFASADSASFEPLLTSFRFN